MAHEATMVIKLLGTATAAVVLITAAVVFVYARRQQQRHWTLPVSSALLVLLGGMMLWGLWLAPAQSPPATSQLSPQEAEAQFRASQTALPTDTPEQIVLKMGCAVCHKIPTIPHATVGVVGPPLILKTTAPLRLASPEYQARVRAGLAHATTPKEYVIESITEPAAFIVPGYEPEHDPNAMPMYPHYRERFTEETLNFFALFLLQLDEEMARREGLLSEMASPQERQ